MKLPYPQSVNCSFDDFPAAYIMTGGKKIGEIVPGTSFGSRFKMFQTPKSRILQGEYVVGQEIPDLAWIYSDTGNDDDFSIKVSYIGYGTFYRLTKADKYLRAQVYKAIVIETPTVGKKEFGDTFDCETLIPATDDVAALFAYDTPVVQYTDGVSSTEADDGSVTVEYNGKTYTLSNGNTVFVTSSTGGTRAITYIDGNLVMS